MNSKIFLVFGLSMATVLLMISSGVAARDLAQTSTYKQVNANKAATVTNGVHDAKFAENPPLTYGNPPLTYGQLPSPGGPTGYNGGRGTCPKGCCGGGYQGRGCRCC